MASIKQTPSGAFQLRVKSKLLPKTFWATFDTRDAAEQYGAQLERLLNQGIVPSSLLEREPRKPQTWTIGRCIVEYQKHNAVPESDIKLLDTVLPKLALLATNTLNYDWAEAWVVSMKRVENLAPSTVRHRHGALARCFDWMTRKHPEIMTQNPLRLLKRGFSSCTPEDAALLAQDGKQPRFDIERDRRMEEGEEAANLRVLEEGTEERVFFILALETAMRMRKCYTLHVDQLSLQKRTIHLERSKNGETRQVPLSSVAREALDSFIREHQADITAREQYSPTCSSRRSRDIVIPAS